MPNGTYGGGRGKETSREENYRFLTSSIVIRHYYILSLILCKVKDICRKVKVISQKVKDIGEKVKDI